METKTYLIKHEYDFNNKKMKSVSGSSLTIQFKVMDSCTMVEIVGCKSSTGFQEFKHQILCHKDQMIKILPTVNDQVQHADKPVNKDRVIIDQNIGVIHEDEKSTHYMLGLHGQLDLFEEELN